MAELSILATQVIQGDDPGLTEGQCGTTITAGMTLYFDDDNNRYYPADANTVRQGAEVEGIALNGGSAGQTVRLQTEGTLTIGAQAAPAVGTVYVLGATPGSIAPVADLAAGWYRTIIGVGDVNNTIQLGINPTGIVP